MQSFSSHRYSPEDRGEVTRLIPLDSFHVHTRLPFCCRAETSFYGCCSWWPPSVPQSHHLPRQNLPFCGPDISFPPQVHQLNSGCVQPQALALSPLKGAMGMPLFHWNPFYCHQDLPCTTLCVWVPYCAWWITTVCSMDCLSKQELIAGSFIMDCGSSVIYSTNSWELHRNKQLGKGAGAGATAGILHQTFPTAHPAARAWVSEVLLSLNKQWRRSQCYEWMCMKLQAESLWLLLISPF